MKTSEILWKAASEVRRRGLHKGEYGSDRQDPGNCAVCSLGAIRAAITGDPFESSGAGAREVLDTMERVTGYTFLDTWNDAPARTAEEVVSAFEQGARLAEEVES